MISQDVHEHLEDILAEIEEYVLSTYGEHYVGETDIQSIDIWETNGSLVSTCRDTASKYLQRLGKKDGFNKKDLLKLIHYALIIYAYKFPPEKDEPTLSPSVKITATDIDWSSFREKVVADLSRRSSSVLR